MKFQSKIENINIVEKLVDEISASQNLSSEIYGNLLVAMVEAVNNAIIHGNKLDESKEVVVNYGLEDGYFWFNVKDQGPGFDFNSLPDPTLPENIEKPHGRGIFLMSHLVDEIKFEDNGTKVCLKIKI
ncbi:MAG: ATP-binding protein [Bacteroidia bacterium]|nr:ATP-binding protein [Bacteroidia bacterium]